MVIGQNSTNGESHFYLSGQINSARMVAGNWPIWEGTYTPYGQEINPTISAIGNNYKYTGMEQDAETDLGHTQYRQFTPVEGRWMSPDPYNGSYDLTNPQSFNRYGYVNNQPMQAFDPYGLRPPSSYGSAGGVSYGEVCSTTTDPGDSVSVVGGNTTVDLPTSTETCELVAEYSGLLPTVGQVSQFSGATTNNMTQQPDGRTLPSCRSLGIQTAVNDLNPFSPSVSDVAQGAAAAGSVMTFSQAVSYAAKNGLTFPNKSSVFRGLLSQSSFLAALADAVPYVLVDYAAIDAIHTELTAQCSYP